MPDTTGEVFNVLYLTFSMWCIYEPWILNDLRLLNARFQIRIGEEEKREKKRKREITAAVVRKVPIDQYIWEFMMIPLRATTAHEICCGNKSNHLDSIFDCLI